MCGNSGERKAMLQKLLLAVMITFSLNLFLGVHYATNTTNVTKAYLAEMSTFSNSR